MATPRMPVDSQDQADLAEEYYEATVRAQNQALILENLRLKGLLRTHGISWSPSITFEPSSSASTSKTPTRPLRPRKSLSKDADQKPKMPHLPMEVQLRILHYALTSNHPILDPLSKIRKDNITAAEKTIRENQVVLNFLATCKTFHTEGTRILWANNSFVFTTHTSLRNFSKLDLKFREGIKRINLRIIAQFYDDEIPLRTRKVNQWHHPSLKKDITLKVHPRHKENALSRKGFRSYTWTQAVDFLDALRPPHYPGCDKSQSRPKLLPNLEAMRIDFVNFFEDFLGYGDHDLHEAAGHDNGFTLSELMITGLPCVETGMRGGAELARMVRDNGLFMDAGPAFVQMKTRMKALAGPMFCKRVTRGWRAPGAVEEDDADSGCFGANPPVPVEADAPASKFVRPTVWKRVPVSRDSEEREWVQFDKKKGLSVAMMEEELGIDMDIPDDSDDDDEDEDMLDLPMCAKCMDNHPIWGL